MKYKPRPYQTLMLNHLLSHDRCALWAGMGLGKTVTTLSLIPTLRMLDNKPVLVVAPLRVARKVWTDEVRKWDHLKHLRVSPIIGDQKQRLVGLYADADVYTINYENLEWLVGLGGWKFGTVIADESTRLKSYRRSGGGRRALALSHVAFKECRRFIELTGTPAPNGLIDLWGQLWFLDKGKRLGADFGAFKERWFNCVNLDAHVVKYIPHGHAEREIMERVGDICLPVKSEDWFDLKQPIITNVEITLPHAARRVYDKLEQEMFMRFDNETTVSAFSSSALTIKSIQAASGAVYLDGQQGAYKVLHDEKIDALKSIITEMAGANVLVAYHFKSDAERLLKAFPQARVLRTTKDEDDWNAGEIPIMLIHPQSAGHGLNLQHGGNVIVFFTLWWDYELYAQCVERIGAVRQLQAGYNRNVFIYNIVAGDTVDMAVLENREGKHDVQTALMNYKQRR